MSFLDKKKYAKCGNIYSWIAVLVIGLLFTALATIPSVMKFIEIQKNIKVLTENNNSLKNNLETKKTQLENIKKEFNKVAKDFLKEEKLLFPESINTDKIAKVLELYSLQYSLINNNSYFEISSISFSKQSTDNFTKTSVSLSIKSTKESLKDFIYYIQKNKLPQRLVLAQKSNPFIAKDKSTSLFLKQNSLPIANIESIVSNKNKDKDVVIPGLLDTEMQINFFSQKTKEDEKQ